MTDQKQHPLAVLRADIKAALPTFGLKNEREQERMSSVLMIAVEKNADLVFADRQSLIAAVRSCANHGLVPDGNEATIQVYRTKGPDGGYVQKCQYQPMVRGIINRVLNSGKILTFWAELVYDGEPFRIDISHGDRRPIHEVPNYFERETDASKIVGAFSVAKFANGSIDCEAMDRKEITKIRNSAKTQKVWENWFEEKAKVAVLRRHSKRLPLSADDMDMIMNRAGDEHDLDADPRDITPPEPKKNLAQQLAAPNEEEEPAIEGEVVKEPEETEGHWTDAIDTSDAFPGDDAYGEGAKAFSEGVSRSECPHGDHDVAAHWLGGYDEAKRSNDLEEADG